MSRINFPNFEPVLTQRFWWPCAAICDFLHHLRPAPHPPQECLKQSHMKLKVGLFSSVPVCTSNLLSIFQNSFRLLHIYLNACSWLQYCNFYWLILLPSPTIWPSKSLWLANMSIFSSFSVEAFVDITVVSSLNVHFLNISEISVCLEITKTAWRLNTVQLNKLLGWGSLSNCIFKFKLFKSTNCIAFFIFSSFSQLLFSVFSWVKQFNRNSIIHSLLSWSSILSQ